MSDKRRLTRTLKVLVFGVIAWILIAAVWAWWLPVTKPSERADAIVILSGSKAFHERSAFAATLYLNGVAPRILLTNDGERASWSNVEERNPYYHELATRELKSAGVSDTAITLVNSSVDGTLDEAHAIKKYADENQINSILIVTSGYHSRRALWTFGKVFSNSGVTIGVQSPPASSGLLWWIYPQGWRTVGAEFVKMVYYRVSV